MARNRPSSTYVGRHDEITTLSEHIRGSDSGAPAIAFVCGPAGIGKSRLVEETAASLGVDWVAATCTPRIGPGMPFGPWREIERELSDEDPTAETEWQATGLGPLLRRLTTLAEQANRPLVCLEDVQWADSASVDLLSSIVRRGMDVPFALVVTMRRDQLDGSGAGQVLQELSTAPGVLRLDLEPLSTRDIARLVSPLAPGEVGTQRERDLIDVICSRAGGNPLIALQLAAASTPGSIPSGLRAATMQAFAAIGEDARQVTRWLAVCARPMRYDDLPADLVLGSLDLALRDAILHRVLRRTAPDTFGLVHGLMGEVVYDDLMPGERRLLHESVARSLTQLGTSGPSEIADHWFRAGVSREALRLAVRAGRDALDQHAPRAAWVPLSRAVALWTEVEDPEECAGCMREELVLRAADAAIQCGELEEAQLLLEPWERVDSGPGLALRVQLGRVVYERGDADTAEQHWRFVATAAAPGSEQREIALQSSNYLAGLLAQTGRNLEALDVVSRALSTLAQDSPPRLVAHAMSLLGYAHAALDSVEPALQELRAARDFAEAADEPAEVIRAEVALMAVLDRHGRLPEALESARVALDVAVTRGLFSTHGGLAISNLADILRMLGEWDEALEVVAEAHRYPLTPRVQAYLHAASAQILASRGEHLACATALRDARVLGIDTELHLLLALEAAEVESALWSNRFDRAAQLLARDYASNGEFELDDVWRRRALQARTRAAQRIEPPLDSVAEAEAVAGGTSQFAAWATLTLAESDRGSRRPSAMLWSEATGRWRRLSRPYETAYCEWRQAAVALTHGRRERATSLLGSACLAAERLGAAPLVAGIRDLASRARLAIDTGTVESGASTAEANDAGAIDTIAGAAGNGPLTERERTVAGLLRDGLSNKQIANRLFIAESTVSVHVSNILHKLQLTSRHQVAAFLATLEPAPDAIQTGRANRRP